MTCPARAAQYKTRSAPQCSNHYNAAANRSQGVSMVPTCGPTDTNLGSPTAANLASRGDQLPFLPNTSTTSLHPRRCADHTADSLSHRRCTKCTTSLPDPTRPPHSRKSDHSRIHLKGAGASWTVTSTRLDFTITPAVPFDSTHSTLTHLPTQHHAPCTKHVLSNLALSAP